MTDRQQTALFGLQSTCVLQSMNTILWADEKLWYGDTTEATVYEVSEREAWELSYVILFMWLLMDYKTNNTSITCVFLYGRDRLAVLQLCIMFCLDRTITHLAYRPLLPAGNKYLQQKWDKASYELHRRKVRKNAAFFGLWSDLITCYNCTPCIT